VEETTHIKKEEEEETPITRGRKRVKLSK